MLAIKQCPWMENSIHCFFTPSLPLLSDINANEWPMNVEIKPWLNTHYTTYHSLLSPPSLLSPRNIRTMTFRFSLCGFDNLMWKEKSLWFNLLYLRDDLAAIWMRTSSRKVTRLLSGKSSDVVKISFTAIPPDKAKSCSVYLKQVICR